MPIFDHMLKMDKKAVIKVVIQGATDKWGGGHRIHTLLRWGDGLPTDTVPLISSPPGGN